MFKAVTNVKQSGSYENGKAHPSLAWAWHCSAPACLYMYHLSSPPFFVLWKAYYVHHPEYKHLAFAGVVSWMKSIYHPSLKLNFYQTFCQNFENYICKKNIKGIRTNFLDNWAPKIGNLQLTHYLVSWCAFKNSKQANKQIIKFALYTINVNRAWHSLFDLKPHAKFHNPTITPSGRKISEAVSKREAGSDQAECWPSAGLNGR